MHTPTCSRCGTCCRKGGPLLHKEDASLITQGFLPLNRLITLRSGEWAHDPTTDTLQPLTSDVIKIRGTGEQAFPWHCVLHDAQGCTLHPQRPAQCAALFCQDTSAIKYMYAHNRLTREELLQHASLSHVDAQTVRAWCELVRIHEAECSVERLTHALTRGEGASEQGANGKRVDVEHMVRYDAHFRDLCVQKAQIEHEILLFLFGRPLSSVVRSLQVALKGI